MAFKRKKQHNKKNKRRHSRKSWSDRFVTNLIKNQFKSRLWRRVREFIDSFLPRIVQQESNNDNTTTTTTSTGNTNDGSTQVLIVQDQVTTNSKIFGAKSKLLIHGFSLWYDLVSFLLSRERLALDSEGHYTGTLKDYLAKVYREYGLLSCVSNRQVMGSIAKFLASTVYTLSIQMPMDSLCENVESSLVKQLIRRADDILLNGINYPIDTTCLLKFKRGTGQQEKMSLVQSMKQVREEHGIVNGWYRGFGWSVVEGLLSEATEILVNSGMNMLFSKLLGLENTQVGLSGDQLSLFNKLQSTTVDFVQDILLSPLRFCILRYRTDMVNQYSSPIDCFKQVHSKEGFTTFYKGTFIGTFLAKKSIHQ